MMDGASGERPVGETAAPVWRTVYTALALDAGRAGEMHVLVMPVAPARRAKPARDGSEGAEAEAWELPWWVVEEKRDHESLAPLAAEARERLGLDVVVLRVMEPEEDAAERVVRTTVVLELRDTGRPTAARSPWAADRLVTPPGGGRWVTRADVETLTPRDAAQWALVDGALDELGRGAAPAGRTPWAQPGWFAEASDWMVERLVAMGRPTTGPVEQLRNWCISSVLRAPTAAGYVYLKAASAHFGAEARLTSALAERFPAGVPRVLAADLERSWLLLDDAGDALRRPGAPADVALWERALCLMGELQRACAGETAWLLANGCADRRLARLRAQIPALLDAPETRAETDPALLARLVARVPEFQAACDALGACGVPETLIHGDLHAGNVGYREGRLAIFDWTDAAVAHPFFDLLTFLPWRPRPGIDDPAAVSRRLRDAYLEGWTAFAPPGELRRAVALAQTLGYLHHTQSYLQILRSVEAADYWQFRGDMARWLALLDDRMQHRE